MNPSAHRKSVGLFVVLVNRRDLSLASPLLWWPNVHIFASIMAVQASHAQHFWVT